MSEPTVAAHACHGADEQTLADWLRLALTEGVGPVGARKLLYATGWSADRAPAGWRDLVRDGDATGLPSPRLAQLLDADDPQREASVQAALAWRRGAPDRWLVSLADPAYPRRLLQLHDAPLMLYVQGDATCLGRRQLAIVGSRRATVLGLATARAFGTALAERGWVITSGLAEGIDGAGHEGALQAAGGATVAVMGTGSDRVYPARHRALADRIRARGALVTEQPLGIRPIAANFPRRNRLIAAMAEGVIVVEAAAGSGSLITAQVAVEMGREVFAVPGSIHSPQSRGCHRLLRQGATLTETLEDILSQLPAAPDPQPGEASGTRSRATELSVAPVATGLRTVDNRAAPESAPESALDSADRAVLHRLAGGPVDTDRLHATLGGAIDRLLVRLQLLELQGLLGRDAKGDWFRLP